MHLYHAAKELIIDYDKLVRRAQSAMDSVKQRFDPKERSLLDTGTCPDCGNQTVLVGADDEARCHFCDKRVSVRQCQYCGEYLPEDEMVGSGICSNCFSQGESRGLACGLTWHAADSAADRGRAAADARR
jgi:ribosomal protein S27E